jgi:cbb3-type cytochrome oxidase cytochrome c subunit
MSKRWAKEDRYSWEQSEVMRNFESQILSNYKFLEKTSQDKALQKTKALGVELKNVATEAGRVGAALNKLINSADDAEDMKSDVCENNCEYIDDNYADSDLVKEELISELESMAQDAISSKNIKLAYLIERTISELKENDDD